MSLDAVYQNFRHEARIATAVNTTTILMIVLPLIALTVALPTLRLGVTLKQLRVVLIPAGTLLGASLPMIPLAVKTNRARNRTFKPYMTQVKKLADSLPKISKESNKKKKKTFRDSLVEELIQPTWATDFRYFLLTELAKSYPKGSTMKEQIEKACQKAINS